MCHCGGFYNICGWGMCVTSCGGPRVCETAVRVEYWGLSVDNDNWIVGWRRYIIGGGLRNNWMEVIEAHTFGFG